MAGRKKVQKKKRPARPKRSAREVYLTRAELAWAWGVSSQAVGKWIENGAPARKKQGYDLSAYIAWHAERARKENPGGVVDLRLKTARAEREELRVKHERGLLVEVKTAEQQRLHLIRWVVGVFDRAGSELASRLAGKRPGEIKREVGDYFNRLRAEVTSRD